MWIVSMTNEWGYLEYFGPFPTDQAAVAWLEANAKRYPKAKLWGVHSLINPESRARPKTDRTAPITG